MTVAKTQYKVKYLIEGVDVIDIGHFVIGANSLFRIGFALLIAFLIQQIGGLIKELLFIFGQVFASNFALKILLFDKAKWQLRFKTF